MVCNHGCFRKPCARFCTVIVTSMNEGKFPGKSQNSFIPYDVKRELGLPTFKEKDAIYTYHFIIYCMLKTSICFITLKVKD
jgi:inactivated superfamily I helicase